MMALCFGLLCDAAQWLCALDCNRFTVFTLWYGAYCGVLSLCCNGFALQMLQWSNLMLGRVLWGGFTLWDDYLSFV